MADDRPIIIKRIKKSGGGHHGGAWKVAYADFVTAMMAFFLLLWLLNAVTEEQKKGIAQYFRPTIAPQSSQSQEAILNGTPAVMSEVSGASAAEANVDVEDASEEADANSSTADSDSGSNTTQKLTDQTAVPSNGGEKPVDLKEAKDVVAKNEQKEFDDVKKKIEDQIKQDPGLADLKNNIDVQQTPEGLRIELLDKEKVSMFPSGSAAMNERSRQLMQLVARVISPLPNKLSISGHTDATPYQGKIDYSNWELSTDRANAARRALETFGVNDKRMEDVAGKADTDPKLQNDPFSPENRRISIVLLREAPAGTQAAAAPAQTPAPAEAAPSPIPPQIVPDAQLPGRAPPPAESSSGAPAEPQPPQSVTTP
jgi:chemotaxis protein MotB